MYSITYMQLQLKVLWLNYTFNTQIVLLLIIGYFKTFKSYSFYNNNTRLQIYHEMILLGGEPIRNIFGQGKPWKFLPWIKNPIQLMPAVGFEPTTPSHSVVVLTPRLVHCLNNSATEHWVFLALYGRNGWPQEYPGCSIICQPFRRKFVFDMAKQRFSLNSVNMFFWIIYHLDTPHIVYICFLFGDRL